MSAESVPTPKGPAGLLLSRDLIFTTKITGTARALGKEVLATGGAALALAMLSAWRPEVVFVDLSAGELVSPSALARYQEIIPGVPFLAFGSHVDTQALAEAAKAGCDPVMPRSRFAAELPALIAKYLPI